MRGCHDLFHFQLLLQGLPDLINRISLRLVETAHNALVILSSLLDLLIYHCLGYFGGAVEME